MKQFFVLFDICLTDGSQRSGLSVGFLYLRRKSELIIVNCNSHVTKRSTGVESFAST